MNKNLTYNSLQKMINQSDVFKNFIDLQEKFKKDIKSNQSIYSSELIQAIQESPKTTKWVKEIVIPKIHEGSYGLNEILIEVKKENNVILAATKMQILVDILESLPENLDSIQKGVEEGSYNIQANIQNFEEQIPFKILH